MNSSSFYHSFGVTIVFPLSLETSEIITEASKLNTVCVKRGGLKEINFMTSRYYLKDFIALMDKSGIPYDLYEYAKEFNTPRVMKVRPDENYRKEIPCLMFTGQDDGDEDGLITVSDLKEIINSSSDENLKETLLVAIKKVSFKEDDIPEIDEY